MRILDKAKDAASYIKTKTTSLISDDKLADLVIISASKQESVNQILAKKGSNYRISDIDIEVGIPPSITFGIRRISEKIERSENETLADSDEDIPKSIK